MRTIHYKEIETGIEYKMIERKDGSGLLISFTKDGYQRDSHDVESFDEELENLDPSEYEIISGLEEVA